MPPQVKGRNHEAILQAEEDGTVDRYGVHSLTRVEKVPDALFSTILRQVGSIHPRFPGMAVSKINWSLNDSGTFRKTTYIYEGFIGQIPDPTYELTSQVGEEPIQTHQNFAEIAGTPSAPANGAVFIDPDTNQPTKNDEKGVFLEFRARAGDDPNDMAGVSSFVAPAVTWTEISYSTNRPSDIGQMGKKDFPNGPHPSGGGSSNWLFWEMTYTKRGFIYEIRRSWRLSGPKGWNNKVYGTA